MSELNGFGGSDGVSEVTSAAGDAVETVGSAVHEAGSNFGSEASGLSGIAEGAGNETGTIFGGGNGNEFGGSLNLETFGNETARNTEFLEAAQKSVENYHMQSIDQILSENGKYISEQDQIRIAAGADDIKAIEHDPNSGATGSHFFDGKETHIKVSAISPEQMERSTKHETNHFASFHNEVITSQPERNGYTVTRTVGTKELSFFYNNETQKEALIGINGQGLNEGLTTMYTNQQLAELSEAKGLAAERQGIYSEATGICKQLEGIVGPDSLKEAYYGGNMEGLKDQVDALGGEKSFEQLRDCLDRTISKDIVERRQAMLEAQDILARMYDAKGKEI